MNNSQLLLLVGMFLLALGAASGFALFVKSIGGKDSVFKGPAMGTLWGLFLICMVAGIIIVASIR